MAAAAMPRLRLAPGAVLARGTLLWERGHEQLNSHVSNPELKERAHLARPHEKQQLLPPSPGVITPKPTHTHTQRWEASAPRSHELRAGYQEQQRIPPSIRAVS